MTERRTIQEMQALAKERGGSCLSSSIEPFSLLTWQCKEGHQWQAAPFMIRTGKWCPICAGRSFLVPERNIKEQPTIQLMRKIAADRGGECLSPHYIHAHEKLTWQCKEGHQWQARPNNIRFGKTWCPVCAGVQKHTLEKMHALAAKRGGKCLSHDYIHAHEKLTWQCKEGHQWQAQPSSIVQGTWCPACAGTLPATIEDMRALAKERGGLCLSTQYTNFATNLTWQCVKGHRWQATPGHVTGGTWCPVCAGVQKGTLEEMHALAAKHGGKCLSPTYINAPTNLTWQCKEGHQWQARPSNIQQGRWCPVCAGVQKGTLEEMHALAANRSGKCLSTGYINNSTKLSWQCKEGHQWHARPSHIKRGQWCPVCAK